MADRIDKKEKIREPVKDRPKEADKQQPKDSDFNEVLQKSKMPMQPQIKSNLPSKAATEHAIKEAVKHQDRRGDEQKKDEDNKDKGRDSRDSSDHKGGKIADQKVIAKGKLKQGNQGQSGQGKGGGFGMGAGRKKLARILEKSGAKSVPLDLKGKFAKKLSDIQKAAMPSKAQMSQEVMNKIIQYVRVGINTKGEKEIQMELHEKIFRGLKLRIIAKDGKVHVHFTSADKKGREVMEKNKNGIKDALAKKGIEVDEILVT